MRVFEPSLSLDQDQVRLVCGVVISGEERSWQIGAPSEFVRFVAPSVVPFLPLATVLCSFLGEDLQIDQAISPAQLDGLRSAAELFAEWWGWSVPNIQVAVETAEVPTGEHGQSGLLFTRGVDSTASLVAALDGSAPAVTQLIGVDGLEPNHSPRLGAQIWADTQAVADSVGLPLIRLRTNLRDEADRFLPWGETHGAVLLGTALVLGPMLDRLCISQSVDLAHDGPHGSSARLDPMWSTATTQVVAVHPDMGRVQKAAVVATRPDLAVALKVCWQGNTRRNCGRCLKCLHTMTCFELVGAADLVESAFDEPFNPEAIRQLGGPSPAVALAQVVDAIGEDHVVLRQAWEDYLSRIANGDRRGLAGLDPAARFATAGGSLSPQELVGWGSNARSIPLPLEQRHALCALSVDVQRQIDWCLTDRKGSGSVELAAELTDHWLPGAVLIVDPESSGVSPGAVSRLLRASKLRCWFSEDAFLDGIRLTEAIEHGCAPIQFIHEEQLKLVRSELPVWAWPLLRGTQQIEQGIPTDEELQQIFQAAVQLAVLGPPVTSEYLAKTAAS